MLTNDAGKGESAQVQPHAPPPEPAPHRVLGKVVVGPELTGLPGRILEVPCYHNLHRHRPPLSRWRAPLAASRQVSP